VTNALGWLIYGRELETNSTVGRKGIARNVIIHGSSFKYLSINNKAQSHARSVVERKFVI
jgi:hypothetical protein